MLIAPPAVGDESGIKFFDAARALCPRAKRVLLVERGEWSSSHPAVRAITLGQIDSYVFIPWTPVERWLYLPIAQFLSDWISSQPSTFEVVTIIGAAGDARTQELRDYLSRTGMPFRYHIEDSDQGRALLQQLGRTGDNLPILSFFSGEILSNPTNVELGAALGFASHAPPRVCDVAIIRARDRRASQRLCTRLQRDWRRSCSTLFCLVVRPERARSFATISASTRGEPGRSPTALSSKRGRSALTSS